MTRAPLHLVDQADAPGPADGAARPETVAARVRRLQAEAKALAHSHSVALVLMLDEVEVLALEIAGGGDAYLPGARDLARRIADDCQSRALTLEAILGRAR